VKFRRITPATLNLDRLSSKVKLGGERLVHQLIHAANMGGFAIIGLGSSKEMHNLDQARLSRPVPSLFLVCARLLLRDQHVQAWLKFKGLE